MSEKSFKNKIAQTMSLLTDQDSDFRKSVTALRKIFAIPQDGFKNQKDLAIWQEKDLARFHKFSIESSLIMDHFGLSERFVEPVTTFILFDSIDDFGAKKYRVHYFKQEPKRIYIEIFGDTTKEDVCKAYLAIESRGYRKTLVDYADRFKPTANINLMRKSHELRKLGKTIPEIADIIDPQRKFGTYDDISKLNQRYEKMAKISKTTAANPRKNN
jgi:hypothetical protein